MGNKLSRTCFYCGDAEKEMTRDHFIPKSHGGGKGKNLVTACKACNRAKGCMTYDDFVLWAIKVVHKYVQIKSDPPSPISYDGREAIKRQMEAELQELRAENIKLRGGK